MKVGIAGVTGKFARRLLTHLLDSSTSNGHESLTVKGYCRDPAKLPSSLSSSPNVELIQGSAFDHEALASFVQDCDVGVCCYLGDNKLMVEGQKALIDACDAATPPVPWYVSSDWALDYTKLKLGELFPKDPMIHVKSSFFGIVDADSNVFRYWGDGSEIMEGTTYDDAARFTARVVLDRQASVVGGRAIIKEIAQSYEKVYGVPVTLEKRGSLDDLYKTMHDLRGKTPQDVYSYMSLFFYYYWVNGQTPADWAAYMTSWPRDQIGKSYFALNM
ncbi:hypothetical protein BDW72DRAFT_208760 [Aspergillus terricola var. indicus]